MKFAVIQTYYSMEYDKIDCSFERLLKYLDECDETLDFIVLPEYSDVVGNVRDKSEYDSYVAKNNARLFQRAVYTAKRCNANLFVNMACDCGNGYRNTTFVIDRDGNVVGKYFKAHPAPSEVRDADEGGVGLDVDYSYEFSQPYTIELEGIRFGFLTCYDFYFYESFARIARENVDVIIGASLQRTDTHQALEIIGRFLSYNTNSYLVRASVSLGENSLVCGSSMFVAPDGTMLCNMKNEVGIRVVDIDPKKKYYKPAGFGGSMKSHYEYIEEGRRPRNYRPAGSAISLFENRLSYPRVCAHRGYSAILPENTMLSFGAAVALGADEIEFDLWRTSDGEIVSCHDSTLERVSNGEGKIYEHSYEELSKLDFGIKYDSKLKGLGIATFEEILSRFSCHTIMNIHIKSEDHERPYPEEIIEKIIALIKKYDCEKHVYFMIVSDLHIKQFKKLAPQIPICVGHDTKRPWEIVDRAIELGCEKVQLFKPYYNKEMVEKAHAHGIKCNVFWSDDEQETRSLLEMGVDTVLTNDYLKIAPIVKNATYKN